MERGRGRKERGELFFQEEENFWQPGEGVVRDQLRGPKKLE